MLSDEKLSPFMEVRTAHAIWEPAEGYAMAVTMDVGSILGDLGLDLLPGDLQALFREGIADSTATLSLTLPAVASGGAGKTQQVSTPIDLSGETELELSTLTLVEGGVLTEDPRDELRISAAQLQKAAGIAVVVLITAAAALAISLTALVRKKKKRPAEEKTPFSEK